MNTELLQRLKSILHLKTDEDVTALFAHQRPPSIRANTLKTTAEQLTISLAAHTIQAEPIAWWNNAFVTPSATTRELTDLDLYKNGHFYIQNLSSMLPPLLLSPQAGDRILDLTAAPGSKTTQLAALMNNTGEIVANDISRTRLYKLKAQLEKYGVTNTATTSYPAEILWRRYIEYFDKTLLDAPCSMEGTINSLDPSTYGQWSLKSSKRLAQQQKWMLRSAISATRVDGIIVYSTCTLAPEENEEIIDWILEKEKNTVQIESINIPNLTISEGLTTWNNKSLNTELHKAIRIVPDNRMEGFFVAKLRKLRSNVGTRRT